MFVLRREGDHERGLLSEKGCHNNFLAFRPADLFMRILGDDVLQLNQALFAFRAQAVEHLMVFDDEGLQGHYAELDKRFEAIRDRLMVLTDYCNKGFEGLFETASDMAVGWTATPGNGSENLEAAKAFGPSGPDGSGDRGGEQRYGRGDPECQ